MLRKLIKYDLQDLFNITWIFYIVIFVLSLLGHHFNNSYDHTFGWDLFGGIIHLALFVSLLIFIIFTIFKIIKRFYVSLFSDQAYLTHTLPVNKPSLFFSKIISSFIYLITNFLVVIYGYIIGCAYVFTIYSAFIPEMNKVKGDGYKTVVESMIDEFSRIFSVDYKIVILVFFIIVILELLFIIYASYVGIILGNRSNNKKLLKSILFSFVTYLTVILFFIIIFEISIEINPELKELVNIKVMPGERINIYQKYGNLIKTLILGGLFLYFIADSSLLLLGNKLLKNKISLD